MRTSAVIGSACAALACAMSGALPVHAASPTYSGRAYALGVSGATVLGSSVGDTTVADTGQLPSGGGSVSNGPGTFTVSGLGTVTVTKEQAAGGGSTATASSVISAVALSVSSTAVLQATVLTAATTAAACGAAPSASTGVATLTVGGAAVTLPVNPAPNTTVTVPTSAVGAAVIATVTFNAQTYTASSNTQSASALVVTFPAGGALSATFTGTITLSHAESDVAGCAVVATSSPAPPVPSSGAAGDWRSSVWSMVLIPAGVLLLGLSLLERRRRLPLD